MAKEESEAERFRRERAAQFVGVRERLLEIVAAVKRKKGTDKVSRGLSLDAKRSHAWLDTLLKDDPASTDPGGISLANLCEAHGFNVRWLLTGRGPSRINPQLDEGFAIERGQAPVSDERADDVTVLNALKRR